MVAVCPVCFSKFYKEKTIIRTFFRNDGTPLDILGHYTPDGCYQCDEGLSDTARAVAWDDEIDTGSGFDCCMVCGLSVEQSEDIEDALDCEIDDLPLRVKNLLPGDALEIIKYRIDSHHDPIKSRAERMAIYKQVNLR